MARIGRYRAELALRSQQTIELDLDHGLFPCARTVVDTCRSCDGLRRAVTRRDPLHHRRRRAAKTHAGQRSGHHAGPYCVARWTGVVDRGLLWALNRKRALFQAVIAVNAFFTLTLLTQTFSLVSILAGISSHSVRALLIDTMLMAISNIVIFSVRYWIIDPPGVEETAARTNTVGVPLSAAREPDSSL